MDVCYARVAGFLSAEHRRKDYEFANYINYINYNTNKERFNKESRCSFSKHKNYIKLHKESISESSTTIVRIVVLECAE